MTFPPSSGYIEQMGKLVNRTGRRYERLVVDRRVQEGPASHGRRVRWLCRCDCGESTIATGHELNSGDTTSCGCLQRETTGDRHRSHGLSKSPTYRSWQAAKERCHNPVNHKYSAYGARGIAMCADWRDSFEAFLADMGERPAGMTLDRIDNERGYEPGNCRWATPAEQAFNCRKTHAIQWRGRTVGVRDIAEAEGVPHNSLRKLIYRGIPPEEAVAHVRSAMKDAS